MLEICINWSNVHSKTLRIIQSFKEKNSFIGLPPGAADSIKLSFFSNNFFRVFAAKLVHFIINDLLLYVKNTRAKQQKLENEEK